MDALERIAVGVVRIPGARIEAARKAARMALYHFHLVDRDVKLDLRVAELRGEAAILDCAERVAVELLEGGDRTFARDPDAWEIRVTDEAGAEVLALPLSEIAGKRSR